jgi:hypothetical protein
MGTGWAVGAELAGGLGSVFTPLCYQPCRLPASKIKLKILAETNFMGSTTEMDAPFAANRNSYKINIHADPSGQGWSIAQKRNQVRPAPEGGPINRPVVGLTSSRKITFQFR